MVGRFFALLALVAFFGLVAVAYWFSGPAYGALDAPTQLSVPAWTPVGQTTWPTYDVSNYMNVTGFIGLEPVPAPTSTGEVTFLWYKDPAATEIVGVKGLPITSLIPSTVQLLIPNLGPYLRLRFQCFSGACRYAMRLFGTNRTAALPLIPGDAIMVDEKNVPLAANGAYTVYPAGYYAGPIRLYLDAPPGWTATLYGSDLTLQWWPLDYVRAGESITTVAPFGAWLIVVSNPTGSGGHFTVSATPDVTMTAKPNRRRFVLH